VIGLTDLLHLEVLYITVRGIPALYSCKYLSCRQQFNCLLQIIIRLVTYCLLLYIMYVLSLCSRHCTVVTSARAVMVFCFGLLVYLFVVSAGLLNK